MSEGFRNYQKPAPFHQISNNGVSYYHITFFFIGALIALGTVCALSLERTIPYFTGRQADWTTYFILGFWIAAPLAMTATLAGCFTFLLQHLRK
jgi:hypothetical protein